MAGESPKCVIRTEVVNGNVTKKIVMCFPEAGDVNKRKGKG